jgi:hypothetical protein
MFIRNVFVFFLLISCCSAKNKIIHVKIFIHGTVGQDLVFPSNSGFLNLGKKIFNFVKLRLGFVGFLGESIKYRWNIDIEKDKIGKSLIGKTHGLVCLEKNINEISEIARETLNDYKNFDKLYFNDDLIKKYYLFNWNGALSIQHREIASKELYENICEIIKKNTSDGFLTKIDLICHSHGGNVAFGLFKFAKKNSWLVQIENLILMGTPIYEFSENMLFKKNINNEYFFKNVFSLISKEDLIQTKDITTGYKMYQKFIKNRSNLFQIYFSYEKNNNKVYPTHQEFTYNANKDRKIPVVVQFIPLIISSINDIKKTNKGEILNFVYNIDKKIYFLKKL